MRRFLIAMALCLPAAAASGAPVEVMVVGAYHFANPGLDTNNLAVDTVLTPQRQRELEAVAKALASFRPTRVMVEMQSTAPDFAIAEYDRFDAAMLAAQANEIVQIGYRTARLAGLAAVNGIDEQPGPGEPDYYPYGAVQATATKFGQSAAFEALNTPIKAEIQKFDAAQKTESVAQLLARMNDPRSAFSSMDSYYGMLAIGDRETQTGADLNAAWYLRNAKIFGKLMQVAKPDTGKPERVLVVYGGGHGFWLRHFASLTPGYRSVDPLPLLQRAAAAR